MSSSFLGAQNWWEANFLQSISWIHFCAETVDWNVGQLQLILALFGRLLFIEQLGYILMPEPVTTELSPCNFTIRRIKFSVWVLLDSRGFEVVFHLELSTYSHHVVLPLCHWLPLGCWWVVGGGFASFGKAVKKTHTQNNGEKTCTHFLTFLWSLPNNKRI